MAFNSICRAILSVFGAIAVAATVVHVGVIRQSSEKQESKATKTPDSNGFTHTQKGSKHDRRDAVLAVVKNGQLNFGFEPNIAPNQVTVVMSDNGTKADDISEVTLKHVCPITEQNGTMKSNKTNNNSHSLKKPG